MSTQTKRTTFEPIEIQLDSSTPQQLVIYAGPMQPDGRRRDWLGTFSPKYLTVLSDALNLYNEITPMERDHPNIISKAPELVEMIRLHHDWTETGRHSADCEYDTAFCRRVDELLAEIDGRG